MASMSVNSTMSGIAAGRIPRNGNAAGCALRDGDADGRIPPRGEATRNDTEERKGGNFLSLAQHQRGGGQAYFGETTCCSPLYELSRR